VTGCGRRGCRISGCLLHHLGRQHRPINPRSTRAPAPAPSLVTRPLLGVLAAATAAAGDAVLRRSLSMPHHYPHLIYSVAAVGVAMASGCAALEQYRIFSSLFPLSLVSGLGSGARSSMPVREGERERGKRKKPRDGRVNKIEASERPGALGRSRPCDLGRPSTSKLSRASTNRGGPSGC
jgi:hypothetical protein